jgi:hypothetical protein
MLLFWLDNKLPVEKIELSCPPGRRVFLEICGELLLQFIGTTDRDFFDDIEPVINEQLSMDGTWYQSSQRLKDHVNRRRHGGPQDFVEFHQRIIARCNLIRGGQSGFTLRTIARRVFRGEVFAGQLVHGVLVYLCLRDEYMNVTPVLDIINVGLPAALSQKVTSVMEKRGKFRQSDRDSNITGLWVTRRDVKVLLEGLEIGAELEPLFTLDVNTLKETLFSSLLRDNL